MQLQLCVFLRERQKELEKPSSLGYEASGLAALPGVCAFQKQELGLVEDIHQHRELSIHQWLQTLLQSVNDVLDTHKHTHRKKIIKENK